jgi:hypothetical protein
MHYPGLPPLGLAKNEELRTFLTLGRCSLSPEEGTIFAGL